MAIRTGAAQSVPDLRARARALPEKPGVYLMKDAKGRVLYVGKAKSLKDRVSQYFQGPRDPKTVLWTVQVREIETLRTPSEVDALLLEARLIKDIRPKYNKERKDGKTFPFLQITVDEPFPRVEVTRDPRPGAALYGPFTDAGALRQAVQIFQRVFRFRTCELSIDPENPKLRLQRPCLLHWIARCTAPCAGLVTSERYAQDIAALRMFVEGGREPLLRDLTDRMKRAAGQMQFEAAAVLRDQIRALEGLSQRGSFSDRPEATPLPLRPEEAMEDLQKVLGLAARPRLVEGIDIATIAGEDSVGSLVTFVDGIPYKDGYRRFRIRRVKGVDDFAAIREVVERRYRRVLAGEEPLPDLILVDGGAGQLGAACAVLGELELAHLPVVGLAKREELLYRSTHRQPLALPRRALALRFLQHVRDEAHRFAQGYHHLLRSKRLRSGSHGS